MYPAKRSVIAIIALMLALMLSACNGGNEQGGADSGDAEQTTDAEVTTSGSKDGFSEDGSYYQLTDKDGVVVRIPIGVPLSVEPNGAIVQKNETAKSPNGPIALSATENEGAEDGGTRSSVYVFSKFSKISFGYGDIKHPTTGNIITDPGKNPYTADSDHILVVQCTDKDLNAVEVNDAKAYYLFVYVLDYKTSGGNLMFSEIIELLYSDCTTLNYFTFSNVVFGTPYTQKSISTYYDSSTGKEEYMYVIEERVNIKQSEGILSLELKHYRCNPDWSVITWTEYFYDDNLNSLEDITYDSQNRIVEKCKVGDDGYPIFYSYSYHPNGQLATLNEPYLVEEYDENGKVILSQKKTETAEGCYAWTGYEINELGERLDFSREYIDWELAKYIKYYTNTNDVYEIEIYDKNEKVSIFTSYDENGNMIYEMAWSPDRSTCTLTDYSPDGTILSRFEYNYENEIRVKQTEYIYQDGDVVEAHVIKFDLDENILYTASYEKDILVSETYFTEDGGQIFYDYQAGKIWTYDADGNMIKEENIKK